MLAFPYAHRPAAGGSGPPHNVALETANAGTSPTRREGRAIRRALVKVAAIATAFAAAGVLLVTPATPAHAAQWCQSTAFYDVCLVRDDPTGLWSTQAYGVGWVVVELVTDHGVYRAESLAGGHAQTDWHPGGRLACVPEGLCVTYLD
jgi:hypothetical protein